MRTSRITMVIVYLAAFVATMASPVTNVVPDRVRDVLSPLPSGSFVLGSGIGKDMNRVFWARVRSPFARTVVLAEAEEAFRRRVDDQIRPGQGLWQGEFWGKWILGAIGVPRHTGDPELRATVTQSVVRILQTRRPDGYIGTYSTSSFVRAVRPQDNNWNVWCRKYTVWALVEAAKWMPSIEALKGACGLMDHLMTEVGPSAIPIRDTGKFYGLASTSILAPVVELYRCTGDSRYLDYARYIVDPWGAVPGEPPDLLRKGLAGEPVDEWFPAPEDWTKAYEFISCVEGLVELYRLLGTSEYLQAAVNIHRVLRDYERTLFGGIGKNDKLLKAAYRLETECEVCDAIYWNRLSHQLLRLTGDPVYADEFERTLYNVLVAAMSADGQWGVRRLLWSGAHWPAPPHCSLRHHHGCVDNVPRGWVQVLETAILRDRDDGLAVSLYLPGTAVVGRSASGPMRLVIETQYPYDARVSMRFELPEPARIPLAFRIPAWSRDTRVRINEEEVAPSVSNGFARITRRWSNGDQIELQLDLTTRLEPFPGELPPGTNQFVAVVRGPLVLARDIRLGDPQIHRPVGWDGKSFVVQCRRSPAPPGIRFACEVAPPGGEVVRMCDYASAGSTWDAATSDFRVWLPLVGPKSTLSSSGARLQESSP